MRRDHSNVWNYVALSRSAIHLWRGVLNEEHVHVVGLTRMLQISSVVRRRMRGCESRSAGREAHITISEEKGTCYVNVCH